MKKYLIATAAFCAALPLTECRAEVHRITIGNFFFSPASLTILKGDTVEWTNAAGLHTSTSDTALWGSPMMSAGGAVYSVTFTNNGSYPYHCSVHAFMTGTIAVTDLVATVAISTAGCLPRKVVVVAGDFVRWTNTDASAHAADSGTRPTPDGIWTSGSIAPGGTFSRQFSSTGTFAYFDSLNPGNTLTTGQVAVLEAGDMAFTGIAGGTARTLELTWSGADTRKYDVEFSRDLRAATGFSAAVTDVRSAGAGAGVISNLPYAASYDKPANSNVFFRLGIRPDSTPALPLRLEVVASNFVAPVALTHAGDGSGRLFVADQVGRIVIVDSNRNVLSPPFLDITAVISNLSAIPFIGGITNSGLNTIYDERGLQGLAFDPGYATNGRFFVFYNSPRSGTNINCESILARYRVSGTNANLADTNGVVIFRVDKPEFNHNGGGIVFGPDGYLYVPLGDGGGGGDVHGAIGNGQATNSLLGKILRLDVSSGTNYAIPAGNPYAGGGGLPEVLASGFRHPWKIAFDRVISNRLVVADVGQDAWEEINLVTMGGNYGWRVMEGNHPYDLPLAGTLGMSPEAFASPIHEYQHGPLGIAVIGGGFYRGTNYPELAGAYVFGDFSTSFGAPDGHLYYLSETRSNVWERFAFTLWPGNASLGRYVKGFGEDEDGEWYLLSSTALGPAGNSGDVRRLRRP